MLELSGVPIVLLEDSYSSAVLWHYKLKNTSLSVNTLDSMEQI